MSSKERYLMTLEKLNILIVDDDDVAIEAFQRSVRHARMPFNVVEADDALEAYAIVKGVHPEKIVKAPFVVLLDINMPRMSGFEFLEVLRNDERLCDIPVYILTTSDLASDKQKAAALNAIGYMAKSDVGARFEYLFVDLINQANTD